MKYLLKHVFSANKQKKGNEKSQDWKTREKAAKTQINSINLALSISK